MIYQQPYEVTIVEGRSPLLTGPLFTKLETCDKRIVICQGGGDAGKTTSILQWLSVKCIQNKNTQVTVSGLDYPNLKRGAIRVYKKYIAIDPQISPFILTYNQSSHEYKFTNGSVISFVSFEEEENAIGAENDYVFMNEANLQSYNLFWQLQRKCRHKIILDYNPSSLYWAHSKLVKGNEKQFAGKVQFYIVDHRHNPFLTKDEHENYENISDPERFNVYSRGLTGKTKGVIFNFNKIASVPTKDGVELPFGFGCDWGYNSDFTAISKVWYDKDKRYIKLIYYKCGVDIEEITKVLKENGCVTSSLIWGDHDKNISVHLRRNGIPYRMARKGPNSLSASISCVKSKDVYYLESIDLESELLTYEWAQAVDLLTGNEVSLNVPVDGRRDDALSSIRYFIYSHNLRFVD